MWKSSSELGSSTPSSRRGRGDNVASTAWKLHAIEQTQLRRQHRVDGVGRPKFDFHTARDCFVMRCFWITASWTAENRPKYSCKSSLHVTMLRPPTNSFVGFVSSPGKGSGDA